MSEATQSTAEPDYQETQRVAAMIGLEVGAVEVNTSRDEISIDFSSGYHLPAKAVDIAQREGFVLHKVFGNSAKFRPSDRT